jgi:DNA-binding NarL/FixJ family response regulator
MAYQHPLEAPPGASGGRQVPNILVACEDPVLLRAVERVISWRRPHWIVAGAVGPEAARSQLTRATYDAVVVCMEVDSPAGIETLRATRTLFPGVSRVAYSTAPCLDPEVEQASERVTGAAAVGHLVGALDRVLTRNSVSVPGQNGPPPLPLEAGVPPHPAPESP